MEKVQEKITHSTQTDDPKSPILKDATTSINYETEFFKQIEIILKKIHQQLTQPDYKNSIKIGKFHCEDGKTRIGFFPISIDEDFEALSKSYTNKPINVFLNKSKLKRSPSNKDDEPLEKKSRKSVSFNLKPQVANEEINNSSISTNDSSLKGVFTSNDNVKQLNRLIYLKEKLSAYRPEHDPFIESLDRRIKDLQFCIEDEKKK